MEPVTDATNHFFKYRCITVSGKIASGSTTLSKNLQRLLEWKYINAGQLQREWDRKNGIPENERGAVTRSDDHEREMEAYAKKVLTEQNNIIYEAWLSGFVAREMDDVLRVLLICSKEALRIDRVVNRENISVDQAKQNLKIREEENIAKWKSIYGDYDFWDPAYYHIVIDTFSSGPMETVGRVLDKLGFIHPKET